MSEKLQRTSAMMRVKMIAHYGEEIYHKHNKNHLHDPPHRKYEPTPTIDGALLEKHERWSAKMIHEFRNRKAGKRLDKKRVH